MIISNNVSYIFLYDSGFKIIYGYLQTIRECDKNHPYSHARLLKLMRQLDSEI